MIRYKLFFQQVTVSVDAKTPHSWGEIQYEGDEALVGVVRRTLEKSNGAYGHLIGSSTTPIDLHAAILSPEMQKFSPTLIEGEDLVKSYNPDIPDGAVT